MKQKKRKKKIQKTLSVMLRQNQNWTDTVEQELALCFYFC